MRRSSIRIQLTVVAIAAAFGTLGLMHYDKPLAAAVAAVIAVGCIAEAWRGTD